LFLLDQKLRLFADHNRSIVTEIFFGSTVNMVCF
jgi:hypothetical protein